jgi:hypothetical protein
MFKIIVLWRRRKSSVSSSVPAVEPNLFHLQIELKDRIRCFYLLFLLPFYFLFHHIIKPSVVSY